MRGIPASLLDLLDQEWDRHHPSRSLTGVQSIAAAEKLRQERKRQCDWPYIHEYAPPSSIPLHQISTPAAAVPALNATAVVLRYQVPDGMRLFLRGIIQCYSGGTVFAAGDLLWTVTVNEPTGGLTDIQGAPVQGLINIPVPLGSWQYGVQWRFERAYEFPPNSVVRSTAKNATGNIPAGDPNFLVSGFFGYLVPDVEVRR